MQLDSAHHDTNTAQAFFPIRPIVRFLGQAKGLAQGNFRNEKIAAGAHHPAGVPVVP
jgi:hypothetical protein